MYWRPAFLLAQGPGWWNESWGVSDWLDTLFNTPLEVHAFFLGVFTGVVIASVTVRQSERTTFALVLVVFLFTFGVLETAVVCSPGFTGCEHIRYKPWYFLGGFLASYLGSEALKTQYTTYGVRSSSDEASNGQEPTDSIGTPLAGLVALVLLGTGAYSFVSPTPVQPISGLATFGGFLGTIIGLAAVRWALATPDDERTFVKSLIHLLRHERSRSILIIAYGTVLGFGYPRIFWELGSLYGSNRYLFGSIIWARNGLPSVVSYVFVLFIFGTLLFWVASRRRDIGGFDGQRFAAIVLGFVTYAFWLFLATGYAGTVWFRLIPAA